MNLDRFAVGLPDKQEKEPEVIAECDGCMEEIFEGEEVIEFCGSLIHDKEECCMLFMRDIGLQKIAG